MHLGIGAIALKLAFGFIIFFFITGTAQSQQTRYVNEGAVLLPDPGVTPGHVAIADTATVCTTKWGTDARHVTKKMKTDVYKAYGTGPGTGVCGFRARTTKPGFRRSYAWLEGGLAVRSQTITSVC
jgi:hypothetical protein